MLSFIKGCTISLQITVDEDITNWEIKAKFYDTASNSKILKSAEAGGSDAEIEKTTVGASSVFVVKMPAYETQDWEDKAWLEIKIDTGDDVGGEDEILPAFKEQIMFEDSDLDWENE